MTVLWPRLNSGLILLWHICYTLFMFVVFRTRWFYSILKCRLKARSAVHLIWLAFFGVKWLVWFQWRCMKNLKTRMKFYVFLLLAVSGKYVMPLMVIKSTSHALNQWTLPSFMYFSSISYLYLLQLFHTPRVIKVEKSIAIATSLTLL
jgi:hypothetical protein